MTEDDLLAAIQAAPDDDAPRLVYADWLLEHGDPRGDLVNAQCTRATCEAAGDFTSDRYRQALVAESIALRSAPARWDMPHSPFVRGLPTTLAGDLEGILARWSAVEKFPLSVIRLTLPEAPLTVGILRQLLDVPPIPTLTTLAVHGSHGSIHLDIAELRELLSYLPDPDHELIWGRDAVVPAPPFHELTTALFRTMNPELIQGEHGEEYAVEQLRTVSLPTKLRTLSMHCERLWEADLFVLRSAATKLEVLELTAVSGQHIGAAIGDWSQPHLRTLRVHGDFDPVIPARRFARSGSARGLRHLHAPFPLDDLLAEALDAANLHTLSLGGGTAKALEHVLRHHPNLHALSLAGFSGDVAGVLVRSAPPQLGVAPSSACPASTSRAGSSH